MVEPLELPGNVVYEFNPKANYESNSGKIYTFISIKKIQSYTDKKGNTKEKFQNLTVKPGHREEFGNWLRDVAEELLNPTTEESDDLSF